MTVMHPLHDYIAERLAERITARGIVVWYDPRGEFAAFVDELCGNGVSGATPLDVALGDTHASVVQYNGSMFEVRAVVEPLAAEERSKPVLIYAPGIARDPIGSVLMELEKAGSRYEAQLKQLARNLLRQHYTDGQIDDLLAPDAVTYADLARAAELGGGIPALDPQGDLPRRFRA